MHASSMAVMSLPSCLRSSLCLDVFQIKCSEGERDGGHDDPKGWLFADVGGHLALPLGLVNSMTEGKPTLGSFCLLTLVDTLHMSLLFVVRSGSLREYVHTQ